MKKKNIDPEVGVMNIEILPQNQVNLQEAFDEFMESYKKAQRKAYTRERQIMEMFYGTYDDDWFNEQFDDEDPCPIDVFPYHNRRLNNTKPRKKGSLKPQRFINGIEVDPDTGEVKTHSTHKKKKTTKRKDYWNEWEISQNDGVGDLEDLGRESEYFNEKKKIVFYKALNNSADTLEFDNLVEFNQWLLDNDIIVNDSDAYGIIYREESHCCLDADSIDKVLIASRSYGELVYEITGGDQDLLASYSEPSHILF